MRESAIVKIPVLSQEFQRGQEQGGGHFADPTGCGLWDRWDLGIGWNMGFWNGMEGTLEWDAWIGLWIRMAT